MNPEVKAKWLTALRSGEYKQARCYLRRDDAFCCLGVLCDLHAKETGTPWSNKYYYIGNSTRLPVEVMDWAGLGNTNPLVGGSDPMKDSLVTYNDGDSDFGVIPRNFTEIADLIEEHL